MTRSWRACLFGLVAATGIDCSVNRSGLSGNELAFDGASSDRSAARGDGGTDGAVAGTGGAGLSPGSGGAAGDGRAGAGGDRGTGGHEMSTGGADGSGGTDGSG